VGVWHIPVIPALGRLKQVDHELKARLVYIVRPCLKIPETKSHLKMILKGRYQTSHYEDILEQKMG
jgi:hypothetical protein